MGLRIGHKVRKLKNILRFLMQDDLHLMKAKVSSLEDSVIYFEYRVDKIHQNIVSYLGKPSVEIAEQPPTSQEVCLVCASNASPYLKMLGYQYYKCPSCSQIFIPAKHEQEFAGEFYNSDKYWTIENTWPKEERVALFKLILSKMTGINNQGFKLVDYGCGINDIAEKKELLPSITFYDPFFDHPLIINDLKKIESSSADAVVCTEVFEHLFHPNAVLAEISKILKPGGAVYLTTLISDYKFDMNYITPEKGHVSIFSMKSIEGMCKTHGFEWGLEMFDEDRRYYMHKLVKK